LLLIRARTEEERVVHPDSNQRRHVRASVWAHGRYPVQLRVLEVPPCVAPGEGLGVKVADPRVEVSSGRLKSHLRSPSWWGSFVRGAVGNCSSSDRRKARQPPGAVAQTGPRETRRVGP